MAPSAIKTKKQSGTDSSGRTLTVFATATVANVACGFDSLGFAIHDPGDEVRITHKPADPDDARLRVQEEQVRIVSIDGDGGRLPRDPMKNTAGVAVLALLKALAERNDQRAIHSFDISIHKKMPLGSGLGSSAASSVAAVVGVNQLLGEPFSRLELLPFVMESERIACGSAHADNVAPGLLGGFILVRSYDPIDVVRLHVPADLHCAVLHPHIELLTEDARKVLKKNIRLDDAIIQWSNLAGLITGLMKEDYDLISRSLSDIIFEPVRSLLIPGFEAVKGAALASGALGCSISGSGPSIFALCRGEDAAIKAGKAMQDAIRPYQIGSDLYLSGINMEGPRIFNES